jgi:uncharacterized membrane protein (DUF373 family)
MKLNKWIHKFERSIIILLVVLMGLIVLFSTFELAIFIIKELFVAVKEPHFLLEKKELLKIFGLFFNVLIGLELFETVKLYLKEDVFHAEFVLLVALIAITRKVIIIEYDEIKPMLLFSMSALIFVLTAGYYFLKKGKKRDNFDQEKKL